MQKLLVHCQCALVVCGTTCQWNKATIVTQVTHRGVYDSSTHSSKSARHSRNSELGDLCLALKLLRCLILPRMLTMHWHVLEMTKQIYQIVTA